MGTEPRDCHRRKPGMDLAAPWLTGCILLLFLGTPVTGQEPATKLFQTYCFECHAEGMQEGGLDLEVFLGKETLDSTLLFEYLITEKMPPRDADQPSAKERAQLLRWMAERQIKPKPNAYRRLSRFEFNQSVNDLLGIELDLAETMADDRGTNRFDTDRRIPLTAQQLTAYFAAADQMLEFAFPEQGILPEFTWKTGRIRDSHHTYNIYTRPFKKGILFSWTRGNNGNSYSFFYDDFAPPVAGWYELTFDAAKVGDFEEDVTIQVHAGKYYFADDRPQPQRLIDVISLGDKEVKSYTVRGFLHPGESVSVHCFSKHTWRKEKPREGVYIKQLKVRGPLHPWPPRPFADTFAGLKLEIPERRNIEVDTGKSILERIGGSLSVSSFQEGMEKERMLDGSNRTSWQSQTSPQFAEPPHFVVIENPERAEIEGLTYSTLSGSAKSSHVKAYAIYVSADGAEWGKSIAEGELLTGLAAEQEIRFRSHVSDPLIKFLVTDSYATGEAGEKICALIGKLDVIAEVSVPIEKVNIRVASSTEDDLKQVIRSFAERAFSGEPDDETLSPYYALSRDAYQATGDFVAATKLALKAILCSRQFLLPENNYPNESYRIAAELARTLWLSVPDAELLGLAKNDSLSEPVVRDQIDRMLADNKSARMVHSFCDQWLNLRFFKQVPPSLKLYPTYDDLLDYYLPRETEMYLQHLIQKNLPASYLIDAEFTFLNQRLAQHYAVDGVTGQQMRKVDLPPDSLRGGLLTMGSILKVTTDGFDTSSILRGAWVSKNIAGNTLAPPPENIKSIEADTSGAKTIREQIELHKENESCAACHKSIDPYGFALESFDAVGQWRKRYRVRVPHEGTFGYQREGYYSLAGNVDSSGEIDDETFGDVMDLKKILLANPKKIAYNLMKQFFEYANGREPDLAERLELYERMEQDGSECRMKDLMKEVLVFSFSRNKDD